MLTLRRKPFWNNLYCNKTHVVSWRQRNPIAYELAIFETSERTVNLFRDTVENVTRSHPVGTPLFFVLDLREGELPLPYLVPRLREAQQNIATRGDFTWAIIIHKRPFVAMLESILQTLVKRDKRVYFAEYEPAVAWLQNEMHISAPQAL